MLCNLKFKHNVYSFFFTGAIGAEIFWTNESFCQVKNVSWAVKAALANKGSNPLHCAVVAVDTRLRNLIPLTVIEDKKESMYNAFICTDIPIDCRETIDIAS